ncbi:MAG: peptidoglycan-binding domain-containing protein [Oscillatoria sp. PMC 1068.18]|nr:peptidoglycan-binding domain-containing protein [Oscillatoria sp. PMC 1068.18]
MSEQTEIYNTFNLSTERLLLVKKYSQLASLTTLSELQEEELLNILKEAESDGLLDFWIHEIDHILAHQLGLTNGNTMKNFDNQQAKMREYLEITLTHKAVDIRNVQENLKLKGFDPGLVDGLEGEHTQTAIKKFQSSRNLETNGFLNLETLEALDLID